MTKIILPSILTMAFSVAALSQNIVRTAQLSLGHTEADKGSYSVEIQLEKIQRGAGINSSIIKDQPGTPENNAYRCTERLSINSKDIAVTYTLKNAAGKVVGRQKVNALMEASASEDSSEKAACRPLFASRVEANFTHALDYVSFKTAAGTISVGASFSAYIISDESYTAYADEASLKSVTYLLNNEGRKQASLIDPANPPVESEEACPLCD